MKPGFTKIILLCRAIFLLVVGMGSVFANPGTQEDKQSEAAQAAHREHQAQHQAERAASEDRRRAVGGQSEGGAPGQPPSNMQKRGGRMTPEERRDLRRQINEAGQDIYFNAPRR